MIGAIRKLAGAIKPVIILEYVYRRNHLHNFSYALSALVVCVCILYGQWPSEAEACSRPMGNIFFSYIFFFMITFSTIIVPLRASMIFTLEKEKNTLTLLRFSGLNAMEIIMSKDFACLIFIAFTLSPLIPFIMACPVFGGISYALVCEGLALLTIFIVFYINAGTALSIMFKKNSAAISAMVLLLLAMHLGSYEIDNYLNKSNLFFDKGYNNKLFAYFSPIEIYMQFFDKCFFYQNPQQIKTYLDGKMQLTYLHGALAYLAASIMLFLANVKFFEKFLKWREA